MFPTTEAILHDFLSTGYILDGCRCDFYAAGVEQRPSHSGSKAGALRRQRKSRGAKDDFATNARLRFHRNPSDCQNFESPVKRKGQSKKRTNHAR